MIYLLPSIFLLAIAQPISKFIFVHNVFLLLFCLLYIGIRVLVQIPWVVYGGHWKLRSQAELLTLILMGGVGASLQLMLFYGVSVGVPVSVVTFLICTHPLWTLLWLRLFNQQKASPYLLAKVLVGMVGIKLRIVGISLH